MIPAPSPRQVCDRTRVFLKRPITDEQYGAPANYARNIAQRGDALELLEFHPNAKPIGLIERLIGAVTLPGDLVIDPAAGGFGVLHAALRLKREFIGCDLAFNGSAP